MSDLTFDIKYRPLVDPQGYEAMTRRHEQLKKEISDIQRASSHVPSWQMGRGADAGIVNARRGAHWSANPDVVSRMQEAQALKRQMGLVAPPLPGDEDRKRAGKALPRARETRDDALRGGAAIARMAGVAGIPGAGYASRLGTAGSSLINAVGAAGGSVVAVTALAGAVALTVRQLAAASGEAAQLVNELDKVGGVERARKIERLGDLGPIIERNRTALARYGQDVEQIGSKWDHFWKAYGAEAAPSLEPVTNAFANINTAKIGAFAGRMQGTHQAMLLETAKLAATKFREQLPEGVQDIIDNVVEMISGESKETRAARESRQKREDLTLPTEILEAKAAGRVKDVRRLEWMQSYNKLINDGTPEDAARRFANAEDAAKYKPQAVAVSDLAARGGAVGESLAASAEASRGFGSNDLAQELVTNRAAIQGLTEQLRQPLTVRIAYS